MEYSLYVLNILILSLLFWILYVKSKGSGLLAFYLPALLLKVLAGILLGLVFIRYYTSGDTIRYFDEAVNYSTLAQHDLWSYLKAIFTQDTSLVQSSFHNQPRALLMVKITSFFTIITYNNYWLTGAYFSLFSFWGLWTFANRIHTLFGNKLAVSVAILLWPSILFWASGVTKESLSVGLIGFLLAHLLGYLYKLRAITLYTLPIDFFLLFSLWSIKYYYAGVLIAMGITVIITLKFIQHYPKIEHNPAAQLSILIACGILAIFLATHIHPNLSLEHLAQVIKSNHDAFTKKSEPHEVIQFNMLENNWQSMIINMPKALISGIFRPWFLDGRGLLNLLAKTENLGLLLLTLSALWKFPKGLDSRRRILLLSGLIYCILLATFLALSAPNFGTLVRYKIGFLPVFLLLISLNNPIIKKLNQWLFTE